MPIRGVIFDYGMVLSTAQDPVAHAQLRQITGLDHDTLEQHYWRYRHAYDRGDLNGREYWKQIGVDAGLALAPGQIDELVENDVLMWSSLNEEMLAWAAALQDAGMPTAILSNMGEDQLRYMRQEFAWLHHFTHHTWSCELRIAKPDPAIYTWTCEKLGITPEQALFLDDRPENVAAAQQVGLNALQFRSVEQLRQDLDARGLLQGWPMPGEQVPGVSAEKVYTQQPLNLSEA
jgi:putative hydrolase of the HAD superfamily